MRDFHIKSEFEKPEESIKPEFYEDTEIDSAYRVFLFNDDIHTFDDVIFQLIKAINCSFEKARAFAFEVHVKGKAMVFAGSMIECLKVTSILEEIGLHTQIVGWKIKPHPNPLLKKRRGNLKAPILLLGEGFGVRFKYLKF